MLSPLSWWNDLLVNLPLAYAFAWVVALFVQEWFVPAVIVGYWLTNILGFVLLHVGAVGAWRASTDDEPGYTSRDIATDLLISLGYTLLVLLLVHVGVLAVPSGTVP